MGSEGCDTDPKANVCCKKQEKALVTMVGTLESCCQEIASSTQLLKSSFHVVIGSIKHHRRQRLRKRHLLINILEMVTILRLLLLPRVLYY